MTGKVRKLTIRRLIAIILIIALAGSLVAGCASVREDFERLRRLLGGDRPTTESTTSMPGESTTTSQTTKPTTTVSESEPVETEPPQGEEFVKVARKLVPMLWEVGEMIFYIDLNTGTLKQRYDSDDNNQTEPNPVTRILADGVSQIAGFSANRIFCLSAPETTPDGRKLHDVVAVSYDGSERDVLLEDVDNTAVIDDQWLLVSRFGEQLELVVYDLKKQEEHLIFVDDGNDFFDSGELDYAVTCDFYKDDDGIRAELSYPGYSEYYYMRYLLFRDGEIVEDSKAAAWQDSMGYILYQQGTYINTLRVKTYDDLILYEQKNGENEASLVYDHPDKLAEVVGGTRYAIIDFFYHQDKVIALLFDMQAAGDPMVLLVYDPLTGSSTYINDRQYDNLYQYKGKLAALTVQELDFADESGISGSFKVTLLNGNGQELETIYDQVHQTTVDYDANYYRAWLAGHDLVINFQTPVVSGSDYSVLHNLIFVALNE